MSDIRLYGDIFWINILIATIEIIGRIVTGSLTLLSDGFHQIGDAMGNLVSIVAEHLVQKGWSEHKVRGWSGIAMIAFLLCTVGEIIREAEERISEDAPIDAPSMAIIAGIACALNGLAWYRAAKTKGAYTCGCAFHMHSESKNITSSFTKLHQKADTLVSAVACLGGIGMAYTNTYHIDTLMSMLIAAWLLQGIIVIGIQAVRMIRMA